MTLIERTGFSPCQWSSENAHHKDGTKTGYECGVWVMVILPDFKIPSKNGFCHSALSPDRSGGSLELKCSFLLG